jgi:predicted 3-demethylubiquinone-9 3-methyltransferase (glyoxalase superfamily)
VQKITPFLWFDDEAEEAAKFYVSIFGNSSVGKISRFGEAGPGRKGSVMSVTFRLEGQEFFALNGGPRFTFTPAISFFVSCKTQEEVDDLWRRLSRGGEKGRCGWLKDRYGVSWQIVPAGLGELLRDPEVMRAMLTMSKLDIERLRQVAARSPRGRKRTAR